MIGFDLEKAKAGAKVCTRDGREARVICWDKKFEFPIVALIEDENGPGEKIRCYTAKGRYYASSKHPSDLMLAGEKKGGWINVYKDGCCGSVYPSKEEALKARDEATCVDTIHIEWEE